MPRTLKLNVHVPDDISDEDLAAFKIAVNRVLVGDGEDEDVSVMLNTLDSTDWDDE